MLLINSPNNPTGWTMSRDDQQAVLAHCRRHGIWLVADEVYERLAFDAGGADGAPSFLDIASRDERVVVVNSFSKAWAMTGWRLGWLIAPAAVMADLSKLVEYNTSCAPAFVQAAGEVALRDGEPFVRSFVAALGDARDHLVAALRTLPGVEVPPPPGAMYLFLRLPGASDSLAFCKTLVREAGPASRPGVHSARRGRVRALVLRMRSGAARRGCRAVAAVPRTGRGRPLKRGRSGHGVLAAPRSAHLYAPGNFA